MKVYFVDKSDQAKPKINLSWGMDALDHMLIPKDVPPRASVSKPKYPASMQRKSEQEELDKIMNYYEEKPKQA